MRRLKILVVEDYAPTRDLLEMALTGSYLDVVSVCDGREALVYLAHQTPDLVLTDFIMPNLDGVSLTEEIRRRPELRNLPIVFLTGADSVSLRRQCQALRVAAVFEKPFHNQQLVDRLKEILGRSALGSDPVLCHGWVYTPLQSLVLPADATAVDRLRLPVHPSELGNTEIQKRAPRLVEAKPVEPRIQNAPAPSQWDFLPPGATIPETMAVGRTALRLPKDPTPLGPIPRRPRPLGQAPKPQWVQSAIGTIALFDADPSQQLEHALGRLEAA